MKYFAIFLVVLSIVSCHSKQELYVEKGFYYWKTTFRYNKTDDTLLQNELAIKKLYIHFFDVGVVEKTIQPVGTITFQDSLPQNFVLVPVVFVTQEAINYITENETDSLAKKIVIKIANMLQRQKIITISEIQIDCDWTEKSQKKYFSFLQSIKKYNKQFFANPILLSCTIRLYPMKYYKKMGIPPVDKGLLMCYNLENPTNFNTQNSILIFKTAQAYLSALPNYPLHLDMGLPIFAWAVQFREGKFLKLLHEVRHKDIEKNANFKPINANFFQALQQTNIGEHTVFAGDIIRVDEPAMTDIKETKKLIYKYLAEKHNTNDTITMLLFHYDLATMNHFGQKNIKEILSL
jgi:hypothetical protein